LSFEFISKLKEGTTTDKTIYYLMTPEVVNDPDTMG
jgi:hypothetical protein